MADCAGRRSPLPGIALALLAITASSCATRTGSSTGDDAIFKSDTKDVGSGCEWQCVRWGERCNVDPRGVRKCEKDCEDFRKVCQ